MCLILRKRNVGSTHKMAYGRDLLTVFNSKMQLVRSESVTGEDTRLYFSSFLTCPFSTRLFLTYLKLHWETSEV